MNTYHANGKLTVWLHWLIALAILGMLPFGLWLEELPKDYPGKSDLIGLHKSVGVIVLGLALIRVVWRLIEGFPVPRTVVSGLKDWLARFTHAFLLLGTLFMPVSGIMMSVGAGYPVGVFGFELIAAGDKVELLGNIGKVVHGAGANLLIAAIVLHLLGVFYHSLILKDGTMSRMLGKKR